MCQSHALGLLVLAFALVTPGARAEEGKNGSGGLVQDPPHANDAQVKEAGEQHEVETEAGPGGSIAGAVGAAVGASVGLMASAVFAFRLGEGEGDLYAWQSRVALFSIVALPLTTALGAYLGLLWDLGPLRGIVPAALAGASAPAGVVVGAFAGVVVGGGLVGVPLGILGAFVSGPTGFLAGVLLPAYTGILLGGLIGGVGVPAAIAAFSPTFFANEEE